MPASNLSGQYSDTGLATSVPFCVLIYVDTVLLVFNLPPDAHLDVEMIIL